MCLIFNLILFRHFFDCFSQPFSDNFLKVCYRPYLQTFVAFEIKFFPLRKTLSLSHHFLKSSKVQKFRIDFKLDYHNYLKFFEQNYSNEKIYSFP